MTQQTLNVIVNGVEYSVTVQDVNASPLTMTVNGNTYTVSMSGAAPQPVVQTQPAAAVPQAVAETPAPTAAPQAAAAAAPAAGGGVDQVLAPMPGVILDIAVKEGDSVKKGDVLCALEAMKMKSAIRAPKDGTVASVEVHEGQKVNHNDVLVRFA